MNQECRSTPDGNIHDGNTEEQINGYVVFEWNIQGSDGKAGEGGGGGRWGADTQLSPTPFYVQQAFEQISKDDVNGFSFTSDTCFMVTSFYISKSSQTDLDTVI